MDRQECLSYLLVRALPHELSTTRPSLRQLRQRLAQIVLGDIRKFIDAGVNQKTLEANHTRFTQCRQFAGVSRNHAAPKADVDVTLAARRC